MVTVHSDEHTTNDNEDLYLRSLDRLFEKAPCFN